MFIIIKAFYKRITKVFKYYFSFSPIMTNEISFRDFNMKDWKNFGIYLLLLGLFVAFVGEEWKLGLGMSGVGFIFSALFQGPKIFKILKKKYW